MRRKRVRWRRRREERPNTTAGGAGRRSTAVWPSWRRADGCDGSQLGHRTRHIDTIYDDATCYDRYLAIAVGGLLLAFIDVASCG